MKETYLQGRPAEEPRTGRPAVVIPRGVGPHQADFSSLSLPAAAEWSRILGERQAFPSPITIARVYPGPYGGEYLPSGEYMTGGLANHVAKLDEALAREFPVTLHTFYRSPVDRPGVPIHKEGWRGVIYPHGVECLGDRPKAQGRDLADAIERINANVVHLHSTGGDLLFSEIAQRVGGRGLVVSYHSGFSGNDRGTQGNRGVYLITQAAQLWRFHIGERGVLGGTLQMAWDVGRQVRRRMARSPNLWELSARAGERSAYDAYGLAAISRHSAEVLGNRPVAIMGVPVNSEFFDRDRVPAARRDELRVRLGIKADEVVIMYHARCERGKGQDLLPSIGAELKKLGVEKFKFLLVGPSREGSRYPGEVKREIETRALSDHFILLGGVPQEEVRDLLSLADLCAFPTRREGLGATALEAQLMRVPVVAHRVGGVPDALVPEVSGLLVEVEDTTGFARALHRLIANPEERAAFGFAGRAFVQDRFSDIAVAHSYMRRMYLPQILP